jgi:hypothetical protein
MDNLTPYQQEQLDTLDIVTAALTKASAENINDLQSEIQQYL